MRLKSNLMESIINNLKETDDQDKSNYMMLSRLKSDCDYYLGNGNRNPRNLWAGDEAKQIAKMREFYDKVPEEPEWLTKEDIDDYEDKMINGSEDSPENHIENPTVIEDKNSLKEDNEEAEDITYILDEYNGEVDFVTKEELGLDYTYRVLITSVSEAQNYNYHSDYWGSDSEYQEQNVDLMWQLEKYVGKTVKIKYEDTTVYAKLIGILIDKQYNSIDHTKILIEPINMNESSQESNTKAEKIKKNLEKISKGEDDDFEVEAGFNEFPGILKKLDKKDRLKGFMMLYMSNPKIDELNTWTLDDLINYIKETDTYYEDDKKYIDECINLINELDESSLEDSRNNVIKELSSIIEGAGLTYEEVFEDIYTRAGENSELIDIILSNMLKDYKEYLGESINNVVKELSSIIEKAGLTYEEVFEDIYTRAGENSELIDIILSNMLEDYKEYLGEAAKIATKYNLKEDSYEDSLFTDIEAALNQYGFDVTRYTDAGMMTKNIGWIVSNSEGEVNLTCAGTYLDENLTEEANQDLISLLKKKEELYNDEKISDDEYYKQIDTIDNTIANNYSISEIEKAEKELKNSSSAKDLTESDDSSNVKELEKYIKGSTLNDAAKFLGMYFHGDGDSFEVQGSELIDKKHKDNRIACSMDGDKIASIANDLSNLKEDSIISENDQYRAMLVDLMEDDNTRQEIINCIDKEGKIIGSVSYTIYKDSNEYHVYNIVVSPEYRRKGVGTFLLKSLQDVVGDNDIYFDTLTPSGKALLDKIASYDKYEDGELGANLYKGKIN